MVLSSTRGDAPQIRYCFISGVPLEQCKGATGGRGHTRLIAAPRIEEYAPHGPTRRWAGDSTMPAFEKRRIGRTSLEVTALGLGCATLGGSRVEVSREEAEAIVRAAWAAGVRYIDAAPYYGFGQAERCVGDAMRWVPRDEWMLSTKVPTSASPSTDTRGDRGTSASDAVRRRLRLFLRRDHALIRGQSAAARRGKDRHPLCA